MKTNRIIWSMPSDLRGVRPPCFSEKEWQYWVECEDHMAATRGFVYDKASFCAQCTPQYRDYMAAMKRCRHPGTTFSRDEDGDLVGTRVPAEDFLLQF